MSLNRHNTFSNNVETEFKRRERDFGVAEQAPKQTASTLSSPVNNDDDESQWLGRGGRAVWARVSSGVVGYRRDSGTAYSETSDVNIMGGIKTISTKITGDNNSDRINGIVLETNYDGRDLHGLRNGLQTIAKVLFNDSPKSNLLSDESTLQVFSDRGQPGPVLETVSVTHNGSWGLIKEADITWRVFTQEQFETLSYFLCNLQKTVVVEFGWSSHSKPPLDLTNISRVRHLQSNQSMALVKENDPEFYASEKQFIQNIRTSRTRVGNDYDFDAMKPYEIELERRGVDYDVFIGIIQNYDIQLEDGAYVVTTKLISMGNGITASRNGNIFTNYFNTQFNTDLEKLRLDKDPRIWYKSTNVDHSFRGGGGGTPKQNIAESDLKSIEDWWKIMRNKSGLVFYDKNDAILGIDSRTRWVGDTALEFYDKDGPIYSSQFITDLQYVTDVELKKALIRRGRLVRNWDSVEPEVSSGTAGAITAVIGAVAGAVYGGVSGGYAGAAVGLSIGEILSTLVKTLGNAFHENYATTRHIRSFLLNMSKLHGDNLDPTTTLYKMLTSEKPPSNNDGNGTKPRRGESDRKNNDPRADPLYYYEGDSVEDWLDPLMPLIRYSLELTHRHKISSSGNPNQSLIRFSLESAVESPNQWRPFRRAPKPPTNYTSTAQVGSDFPSADDSVYESIVNHLTVNSSGRAYLGNVINHLQYGLSFASVYVRDVFNPLVDYTEPRLNLVDGPSGSGTDTEKNKYTISRLAAIQDHLRSVDAPPSTVGDDTTYSLLSARDAKFAQENYSFITWGLLETIINDRFVAKDSQFLKLDSSATAIRFHENLVSTDASVCIVPNKNAPRYDKGMMLDTVRQDLSINGINHRTVSDATGTLRDDEMWLYSLFVNVKLIKTVFNRTETVKDALKEILDYISGALVDNYEFRIDQRGSTSQVVDVAYSKYDSTIDRYKFKFNQANSFIRSLDIDLNHTTATQMQAIYGSGAGNNLQGPFESSITPIIRRGEDKLDLFAPDLKTDDGDDVETATKSLDNKPGDGHFGNFWIRTDGGWINYVYPDKETVIRYMYGSDVSGEPINSGTTIPNLTITLTLDGISGIRYWDAFNVDYVPEIYNEQGFFFVTSINHALVAGDWTTTIVGNYRLKSVSR